MDKIKTKTKTIKSPITGNTYTKKITPIKPDKKEEDDKIEKRRVYRGFKPGSVGLSPLHPRRVHNGGVVPLKRK